MKIYGADFSGARNPSRGIYYAEGLLDNKSLFIKRIVHCDDRLDLLSAIHFSKAPWGLDFPFSLPIDAFKRLKINTWNELMSNAVERNRKDFNLLIAESGIPSCNGRCQEPSICCRAVDASINSFSPLKRVMPNMRMMTYAGLKMLSHLRSFGHKVYPFDHFDLSVSRIYEVYPSHGWRQVGLPRDNDLGPFVELFYGKYGLKVKIENHPLKMENQDMADAVVACLTMGYALYSYDLEADWARQHKWISDLEWEHRYMEGLIVKIK
jgi:hypothetical protein